MLSHLTGNWWALAARGAVAILFATAAFMWPNLTLSALVLLFGAYVMVDGMFASIASIRAAERNTPWWPLLLEGIVGVTIGMVAFSWPELTALALLYLIAAWALGTGIFQIYAAFKLKATFGGVWLVGLVAGVLSLAFALLLFVFPQEGALAVVYIIAMYALLFGITLVALGLRLRALPTHRQAVAVGV